MKKTFTARTITYLAIITAVTLVLSLMIIIPVPATGGLVTILDAGIYFAGLLFYGFGGGIVGALTGLLIDLLSGYAIWAPYSLAIHGLQGLVFGHIVYKKGQSNYSVILASIVASLVMIIGYAFANEHLYGKGMGVASLPGNILQTGFGSLVIILFRNKILKVVKVKQV